MAIQNKLNEGGNRSPVTKVSTSSVTVTPAKTNNYAQATQQAATTFNNSLNTQKPVGTTPAVTQVSAPTVQTKPAVQTSPAVTSPTVAKAQRQTPVKNVQQTAPATQNVGYTNRSRGVSQKLADAIRGYSADYAQNRAEENQRAQQVNSRIADAVRNPGAIHLNEEDYSNALLNEAGAQLTSKVTGLMNTARQGSKAYLENQVDKSSMSDEQKSNAIKKISTDMDNSKATEVYNKGLALQNEFQENAQKAEENLTGSQRMVSQAFGSAVAMLPDMILSYGVGQALGIAGESAEIISKIAGDAGLGQMFLSATGSGIQTALDEGFDERTATLYGLTTATIEVATEKMSGGLEFYGKSIIPGADDLIEAGIKKFKNENVQWLLHNAAGMLGEGFEEFVSEIADAYAEKAILGHYGDQSYGQLTKSKVADAIQSFLVGAISALFMNGASGQYSNAERAKYLAEAKEQFLNMSDEDKALAIDTIAETTGQPAENVAANIVNELESSEQENELARALAPETQEEVPQQNVAQSQNEIADALKNPAQEEQDDLYSSYIDSDVSNKSPEDAKRVQEYLASTDPVAKQNIIETLNGNTNEALLGTISPESGNKIANILGFDPSGYDVVYQASKLEHLDTRHRGTKKGAQNVSMQNINDIARAMYVMNNADDVYRGYNDSKYHNSDNSPAASVLFRKKIDGTYYALEVVPDSAKRTAYVKSLDIEPGDGVYGKYQKIIKEADNRLPNANNLGQTSENRAFSTSDSNIADTSANINTRNEIADALQGREVITEYNGQPIYRSVIAQDINTLQGRNANEISALARALGRNVNFAQSLPGRANGVYFSGNDVILDERHLNNKRAALSYLFHEVTHSIGDATSFSNFVSTCQDQWKTLLGDEGYTKKLEELGRRYAKAYDISRSYEELANDNAFKAYMEEELAAEYVEKHLFKSQEEINNLVKTSRSTALRLWQSIKDTIAKLTGIDSKEVAELKKVERMFAKALSESNASREATDPFYSLKSMMSDISDGQMYQQLIDSGVFSKEEADNFVNRINKAMELIEPKRSFLDINEEGGREDRVFHPFKQNSDKLYQVSMDFSTLCKKRIITQSIIERLNMARGRALDAKTQFAIEQLLRQKQSEYKGLQVACALCYVEAARLRSPKVINQFLDNTRTEMVNALAQQTGTNAKQYVIDQQNEFKQAIGLDPKATKKDIKERLAGLNEAQFRQAMSFMDDEKYNAVLAMESPFDAKGFTTEGKAQNFFNAFIKVSRQEAQNLLSPEQQRLIDIAEDLPVEYYLTADGQTELKRKYPEIYRAFNDKVRSATRAKALETNVPYYFGDSQGYVSDSLINKMNEENGLRTQSWSDMQLEHILDNITAIAELSTRGAKMHGYTKVPEFVEVLGRTGLMSNLSLIPDGHTGLDANGELVFSPTEGMPIEDALRLRDKYSNTAGTICIGINDNQILKMMDSDIIDYIIPYHVSGLTRHMRTMAGIGNWDNYQNYQNEREISNPKKAAADPINFSDWFSKEYYNDSRPGIEIMREAQDKYLELCAEKGYIPKFEMFLQNNGDGTWSVPLGADGEPINYWKVLIDRKMIDQNTGDIIEQQPVKPDFVWEDEVDENGDTIKGIYSIIEQAEDPRTQDMVDELTDYVESAMDAGIVDAIAKNDPQVQRMVEEFDKTHLTPEQLLESMEEDEWNGDIKDGVPQSQPVTMPRNAAARFSLPGIDSDGNELSQQQQDYFKDSVVRDDNDSLLVVYHGSPSTGITEFDRNRAGSHAGVPGDKAIWFTPDSEFADQFAHEFEEGSSAFRTKLGKKGEVYPAYLNITNPLDLNNLTYDQRELFYDYASMFGMDQERADALIDQLLEYGNHQYLKTMLNYDKAIEQGYDGIIDRLYANTQDKGDALEYGVFSPEQIKSVDNKNPSNNPDIRFSLPEERYDTYADIPEDVEGNYGYHAGNLGKAESRGSQGYYRGTGHYGTGTYFVGNPQELRYGYENRPVETVDFSNYNLFAPRTEDDAYTLHDYLKAIDGGMGATERINPDVIQDIRSRARENSWGRDYDATDTDVVLTEDGRNFSTAVDIIREARELMGDSFQDVLDEAEKWDGNEFDMDMSEFDLAEYPEIMDAIETKLDEDGWGYSRRFFDDMVDINRMHNREAEVARMTGRSPEEIREIARRSDYDLQGADPYLSDSRATRFMKDLGYEGVDVRALPGLDNTRYGSVIYDLKGRDLERKNANNPRFSIDKDASDLTGNAGVSERVIESLSDIFVRKFKSTESAEDVKSALTDLYKWFSQTNMSETEMRDAAESVAEDLESKLLDDAKLDPEAISVLNRLKEDAFRLSPDQEAEARNAFGNMNEFRKAVAPLKYRKDGALLTDVWSDWSQSAATLGMVEEAYNENDLPMQLAELVSKLKESQAYTDHEARVQDITDFIVDGFTEHARKIKEPDIDLYEAANGGWKGLELKDPTESSAYKDLMGDEDGIEALTDLDSTSIAQQIQGNRNVHGFDTLHRVFDRVSGGNKEVRDWLDKNIERPLYDAKAAYTKARVKAYNELDRYIKKTGIKAGTKESAAVQWYGEGVREVDGKRESYGLDDLKREFPDSWQNIRDMEKYCWYTYKLYLERINAVLEKIYPNVEENFLAKIQAQESKRDQLVKQANDIQLGIENGETGAAVNYATLRRVQEEIKRVNDNIDDLNKQYKSGEYLKNKRLIPRTDYYHHFNEVSNNGIGGIKNLLRGQMTLIDTDLIGKSENTKPKTKWMGFMQHRGDGAYTADAVGGLARYIPGAEFVINMDPAIAHMRAVISELVKSTKNTRNANGLISYLTNFTNDLCGKTAGIDRSLINMFGEVDGRAKLDAIQKLNRRFKANAVGGNIRSALAQFSNIPTALGVIKSDTAWMKGLKDYLQLKAQGNSDILNQSNFMADRYFDGDIDRFTEDSFGKKIKQFSNAMLEFGDREAAQLIWFSAYNEALEKGVEDPVYYADIATQQSVGGRGVGEIPYNMNTKVVNLLAPFQVEVNNTWQQLKKMVGEKDAKGLMRYMVGSFVLESLMEQVFGIDVIPDFLGTIIDTLLGAWREKDEEEPDYQEVVGNGIRNAIGEVVGAIPGASVIAPMIFGINSDIGEALFGEGNPSRYGTGLGGLSKLSATGGELMKAATGEQKLGDVDLFSPMVETLLPFGGRQLTRTYQTAQDLGWLPDNTWGNIPFAGGEKHAVPGSYTDSGKLRFMLPSEVNSFEDASELARALLLGEYSTEAGREYLKDRKTISAEKVPQIEAYAAAGYDPNEYIDFLRNANLDGESKITQAETIEYLDDYTDLDEDQKSLIFMLMFPKSEKKNPYK